MPERVNIERVRRLVGQLNSLGGKAVAGRAVIRMAAWMVERMADEIEALRVDCRGRQSKKYHPTSYRLFKKPAAGTEDRS